MSTYLVLIFIALAPGGDNVVKTLPQPNMSECWVEALKYRKRFSDEHAALWPKGRYRLTAHCYRKGPN